MTDMLRPLYSSINSDVLPLIPEPEVFGNHVETLFLYSNLF